MIGVLSLKVVSLVTNKGKKKLLIKERCHLFYLVGVLSMVSMMVLSLHKNLQLGLALSCLVAGSAGVAIADVTIDACVTQLSISHPTLAADMQSLCGMSSSIGSLVGFSLSGVLVHLFESKVRLFQALLVRLLNNALSVFILSCSLAGCVWFTRYDCRIDCCGWVDFERISFS